MNNNRELQQMSSLTRDFEQRISNLRQVLFGVDAGEFESLKQAILKTPAVHLTGSGRSLLVMRAFAVRLANLGLKAHVLGADTASPFREGGLLLLCSPSGESPVLLAEAEQAKRLGGQVALITGGVITPLSRLADLRLALPPVLPKTAGPGPAPAPPEAVIYPFRTLFEEAAWLLLDQLSVLLMKATGQAPEGLEQRRQNLD